MSQLKPRLTSGPLHLLFPVPGLLFSQLSERLSPFPPSGLSSDVTFSVRPSLPACHPLGAAVGSAQWGRGRQRGALWTGACGFRGKAAPKTGYPQEKWAMGLEVTGASTRLLPAPSWRFQERVRPDPVSNTAACRGWAVCTQSPPPTRFLGQRANPQPFLLSLLLFVKL